MSQTALWVIQQAEMELGLPVSPVMAGSNEATATQLQALLNSAGYELSSNYQWEELNRDYIFDTVDGQDSYDLPDDYNYFIDSTGWDRSNRWPLLGPVSQQEWQAVVAWKVKAVLRTYYKVQNKQITFFPAITSIRQMALSYASKNWVTSGIAPFAPKDMIDQDGDLMVLNPWLMVKLLKVKMWGAKGFDTSMLAMEFTTMWNSLTAKSKGNRVLSLAPQTGTILIGTQNIPPGGFGY